jgi:hypothetical protein
MIWLFLVPWPFLGVVFSGTTQGWVRAFPQIPHYVILALLFFPCVITTFALIPTCLIKVFRAYGLTVLLVHVKSMKTKPPPPLQHNTCVMIVGLYLHVLIWHAIRGNVSLFKLTIWGWWWYPIPLSPVPPLVIWAWITNIDPLGVFCWGSLSFDYILTSQLL